ncbi:MAG: hypothetical protein D6730_04980 [Bacteroidetes bacterium]|nr:MAG: hypothetical protein D6730_04980 [Bacteroidota bacterium]
MAQQANPTDQASKAEKKSWIKDDLSIANFRAYDQRGVHVFEAPKEMDKPFEGLKVRVGGNFTQQFQALTHENTATPRLVEMGENEVNLNQLIEIGNGFNLATANLNLDVQLADGIRLNLVTYLASRHHPEAWVKGGYLQVDKLPMFNSQALDKLMQYVTIKVGHMEINYGDAHFRRTDNGNALYNPFVGNYIMDAFNTEIGGEIYFRHAGALAMIGVSGGEIKGAITNPDSRAPAVYAKLGYDKQVNDGLRLRLTGSIYTTEKSANNTLYGGDRGGSRYYMALQPALVRDWRTGAIRAASESSDFTTGRFNPGFRSKVTAVMVNPFVKVGGLELFGTYEYAVGGSAAEVAKKESGDWDELRAWNQLAVEVIYRFFQNENLYLGGRYNKVSGDLSAPGNEVSIDRIQLGMGWFLTPNILLKGEYVNQQYRDFPDTDYRNGGVFKGLMLEAVVGF